MTVLLCCIEHFSFYQLIVLVWFYSLQVHQPSFRQHQAATFTVKALKNWPCTTCLRPNSRQAKHRWTWWSIYKLIVCFHLVPPPTNGKKQFKIAKNEVYSLRFLSFSVFVVAWLGSCLWKLIDWVTTSATAPLKASVWRWLMTSWSSSSVLWWHSALAALFHHRGKMAADVSAQTPGLHNLRAQPSWALQLRCYHPLNWQNRWVLQRWAGSFRRFRLDTDAAGTSINFSLFYIHIENVWHISF